ncbi:hypothetical protein NMY22_g14181 [Coprinellus aureogranulatus]|nr:hypothetical protein NMY22_g14181 [Coprinellus aureogranulatus]
MTSSPPHFVQEAVFNHVEGDYNDNRTYNVHNIHYNSTIHPLERLERHVSRGAAHNSAERGPDAPKCAEETRKAVQADILSWIGYGDSDNPPSNILWLSGPAGCGKTAIMASVADACYERGWLAGSFFLSSFVFCSPDRQSKNHIIPTLAYHLFQHSSIQGLREEILDAVDTNLLVFDSSLQEQLRVLILQPLAKLDRTADRNFWPKVLLVDGLDECDGDQGRSTSQFQTSRERNHQEIIMTLARAAADPSFPFRIIIASRPERVIVNAFTALEDSPSPQPIKRIFLDDKYSPEADIALYLRASFVSIGREKGLGDGWFPSNAPQALAKEASGQFIYASTVLRFVRTGPQPPHEQLGRVLRWGCTGKPDSQPFVSLDALYKGILNTSPNTPLAALWLRSIDLLSGPIYAWSARDCRQLLEAYPGETVFLLGNLTSLVGLEDAAGYPTIIFYHKSLLDFLCEQDTGEDLHVSYAAVIQFICERFYVVLKNKGSLGITFNDPEFIKIFCDSLGRWFTTRGSYVEDDVYWWLDHLRAGPKEIAILNMFRDVHKDCRWYHCLPACKVWRKGILRYCRARSWRVPNRFELLCDRLQRGRSAYQLPLRAPQND